MTDTPTWQNNIYSQQNVSNKVVLSLPSKQGTQTWSSNHYAVKGDKKKYTPPLMLLLDIYSFIHPIITY